MNTSQKKLLIITAKEDVHTDYMVQKLNQSNLDDFIVRLNTEDFLTNAIVTFKQGQLQVELKDSGRRFTTDEIGCVWYRKPNDIIVPDVYEEDARDFVEGAAISLLQGIYYLTSDTSVWINPRQAARFSSNKLKQIQVAKTIGFRIPETIITNNPSNARIFAEKVGRICTKDFDTSGRNVYKGRPTYTVVLNAAELEQTSDLIEFCPTMLQEYIDKKFDLRVTVIGDFIYGVEIRSQDRQESKSDFRIVVPSLLEHVEHAIPDQLQSQIIDFMKYYGLVYSAFDFAVTDKGDYFFLENNPNGQWLWQEMQCSVRISEGFISFFGSTLKW